MAASHHLSQQQLSGLANRLADPNQGGFSARAFGPDVGAPPSHKLMVGIAKYGQSNNNMPVMESKIGNFATENAEALKPEGRYLGGWAKPGVAPGGTRKADLDVSQAHSMLHLDKAMGMAHATGEQAIGMVGHQGAYIADMPTVAPRKLLGWAAGNVSPGLKAHRG